MTEIHVKIHFENGSDVPVCQSHINSQLERSDLFNEAYSDFYVDKLTKLAKFRIAIDWIHKRKIVTTDNN